MLLINSMPYLTFPNLKFKHPQDCCRNAGMNAEKLFALFKVRLANMTGMAKVGWR